MPERHVTLDDEMRERINSENPDDLRLHRKALAIRAARRSEYGWA